MGASAQSFDDEALEVLDQTLGLREQPSLLEELITVMNRDVWRLENEATGVGAALRATIADCLAQ